MYRNLFFFFLTKRKQIKSRDLIKDLVVFDWLTVLRQQNESKTVKQKI